MATLLRNRGICRKELKEYDTALKDSVTALEIANAINKPAGELRLKVLFDLTQLYRLQGNQPRADETMKLALSVLEAGNPDHEKWIKKYKDLPASGVVEEKKP